MSPYMIHGLTPIASNHRVPKAQHRTIHQRLRHGDAIRDIARDLCMTERAVAYHSTLCAAVDVPWDDDEGSHYQIREDGSAMKGIDHELLPAEIATSADNEMSLDEALKESQSPEGTPAELRLPTDLWTRRKTTKNPPHKKATSTLVSFRVSPEQRELFAEYQAQVTQTGGNFGTWALEQIGFAMANNASDQKDEPTMPDLPGMPMSNDDELIPIAQEEVHPPISVFLLDPLRALYYDFCESHGFNHEISGEAWIQSLIYENDSLRAENKRLNDRASDGDRPNRWMRKAREREALDYSGADSVSEQLEKTIRETPLHRKVQQILESLDDRVVISAKFEQGFIKLWSDDQEVVGKLTEAMARDRWAIRLRLPIDNEASV